MGVSLSFTIFLARPPWNLDFAQFLVRLLVVTRSIKIADFEPSFSDTEAEASLW